MKNDEEKEEYGLSVKRRERERAEKNEMKVAEKTEIFQWNSFLELKSSTFFIYGPPVLTCFHLRCNHISTFFL